MKIYDITPALSSEVAVWEGDTPFRVEPIRKMESGDAWNSGTIHMSLHTGAHADAPWHFLPDSIPIDRVPLENYLGSAYVFSCTGKTAITEEELEPALEQRPRRLLIRSDPDRDFKKIPAEFAYFSENAAIALAQSGLKLVGLDSPSVDHPEDESLPIHRILGHAGISILENLDLSRVEDGYYELIALPLKITGADASPVRAVLRQE